LSIINLKTVPQRRFRV